MDGRETLNVTVCDPFRAKKSSHRRGRNLWKPWSRGVFAPMAPMLTENSMERKDILWIFSSILRKIA
jgi:hypothetical protein